VAVVSGNFRDYVTGHPSRPVLVVEVSESSLALDREHKGSLYAHVGLADYWIVNLIDRVSRCTANRRPTRRVVRLALPVRPGVRARGLRRPLALPDTPVRVVDLLREPTAPPRWAHSLA